MFRLMRPREDTTVPLLKSQLYDEKSFFTAFARDLKSARHTIIIESPFITTRRLDWLYPMLESATKRGVRILINTRDPACHDDIMRQLAIDGINTLQTLGITVLYTGNHHRKLAMIDQEVLWEGSLNILSQNDSCEVMRRMKSPILVEQMIQFTGLAKWYTKGNL